MNEHELMDYFMHSLFCMHVCGVRVCDVHVCAGCDCIMCLQIEHAYLFHVN